MRPRKVKRGDKVYEMRVKENSSQTQAPDQAASTPAEPPIAPATDHVAWIHRRAAAGSATMVAKGKHP